MELHSATEAAKKIGCAAPTVRRLAEENGIGRRLGPVWAFTAGDVEKLAAILQPSGNPTMNNGTAAEREQLAQKAGQHAWTPKAAKKRRATKRAKRKDGQ